MDGRLDDLQATHDAAADIVASRARPLVPVRSGALLDSLETAPRAGGASVLAGGGLEYGGVIHFGWAGHNILPQPFLYDALDERRDAVLARYDDAIADLVRKFDREAP